MQRRIGLVLTGGGARGAYQVGVLKAISESLPRHVHNPFAVICGTSAGALNAATLAANAQNFRKGVLYLNSIWRNMRAERAYRTDVLGVLNNTMLWFSGLALGFFGIRMKKQISLLDNAPLAEFIEEVLPFDNIQTCIDAGYLHALSITASGYGTGQSVSFYQGVKELKPWKRTRRIGVPSNIEVDHLLASSAIPFIFPARLINREYFGDGSMRQIAPISSALHLGATRVLVIGVNNDAALDAPKRSETANNYPSLAQIAGHALNSIFLDSMEVDLERIRRINELVAALPEETCERLELRHVEVLSIQPSQSIDKLADLFAKELPWTIRLLLRLIGASHHTGMSLVSYLLSEKKFCAALIELGYQDALRQRAEILEFMGVAPVEELDVPQ